MKIAPVLLVIMAGIVYFLVKIIKENRRVVHMSFMEGMNLTGFPIVSFLNNGNMYNFLLDTGSNVSLIDPKTLEKMTYEDTGKEITIYGLDGIERTDKIVSTNLSYKEKGYRAHFVVTDLSATFSQIKSEHGVTLHGILGSDFFKAYKYILDFDELIAYSKRSL